MNSAIASGLENSPHLKVFESMIAERFAGIDLTVLLIYMIDTVDVDALPLLAAQFDLLGLKGWAFATTEQQRRDMLKRAIELHRIKGTVAGVKTGLQLIGYVDSDVIEHVGLYYDDSYNHDGAIVYGSDIWYNFNVNALIPDNQAINEAFITRTEAVIAEFQNIRSRLIALRLRILEPESVGFSEVIQLNMNNGGIESTIIF